MHLQNNDKNKCNNETKIVIKNKSTYLDEEESTKHQSKDELNMIDTMSHQVINTLACQIYEASMNSKVNIKVIQRDGDDYTWYKIDGKYYGTMLNVDEIIQYYFNNLSRLRNNNKNNNDSEDNIYDYSQSYQDYISDSDDSTDTENEDSYNFDFGP